MSEAVSSRGQPSGRLLNANRPVYAGAAHHQGDEEMNGLYVALGIVVILAVGVVGLICVAANELIGFNERSDDGQD